MLTHEELLKTYKGEDYDLCFELLSMEANPEEVFEYVCKNYDTVTSTGEYILQKHFTKNEIKKYKDCIGDLVDGLIRSNVKKCNLGINDPKDFYKILWTSYCNNFTSHKEKAFAFFYTLIDSLIPYQYFGKPISMTNTRFSKLLKENEQSIQKIQYVISCGYTQRTEVASLILHCLDEIKDEESKAVVMSMAIQMIKSKQPSAVSAEDIEKFLKQIDAKREESEKCQEG